MQQDFDFPGIAGASACYTSDMNIDCQRAVNFYPERVESPHAKKAFVLRPAQGYRLERDFGDVNFIRGIHRASRGFGENESANALVVVAGAQVWQKPGKIGGQWQMLGNVNKGFENSSVAIADDGVAMLICDGTYAWRIEFENPGKGIRELAFDDIPVEPSACAVAGSYTVVSGREKDSRAAESNRFYVSLPLDNSKFSGLDFYTGASFFSPIRALAACGGVLWLMGDECVEAWQTTGNSNQPLMPVSGMFHSGCGIICPTAFATAGDVLFWLGTGERGNAVAYIASPAAAPKRVSTAPIEEELREYDDLRSCVASCFAVGGHAFFTLAFKDSKKTWVYDLESGMWHERLSGPAGRRRAWDPLWIKTANETAYGANPDGKLYIIGPPELGEDGEPVLRRRTCPSVDTQERKAAHKCLTVSMQAGTGDFKTMLRFSDDNGYTWGATRTQNFSKTGEYLRLAQFRMLGSARRRVYELQISDPVGVSITRASIAMEIAGVRS
jgi:hypothetical protein